MLFERFSTTALAIFSVGRYSSRSWRSSGSTNKELVHNLFQNEVIHDAIVVETYISIDIFKRNLKFLFSLSQDESR